MATNSSAQFGVIAFSSLFAMMDPISTAPMFVHLTRNLHSKRRKIAFRACLTALIVLGLFATGGGAVLSFFSVTVPAFQIAGGILFTVTGMRVLLGFPEHDQGEDQESVDPSIVPIGIPLVAGAGSISTVMVLAGQARDRIGWIALGLAILVNVLLMFLAFLTAPRIVLLLGPAGGAALSKVMGLLSSVIGVQFILNGTGAAVTDLMHHYTR